MSRAANAAVVQIGGLRARSTLALTVAATIRRRLDRGRQRATPRAALVFSVEIRGIMRAISIDRYPGGPRRGNHNQLEITRAEPLVLHRTRLVSASPGRQERWKTQ